ncbi:hypothetical protein DYB28_007521 [Aphanomyces astaci]|uniref:Uncharacterized protein n=1 Tax=Aphanomyces astaci TaxID=112090 RepID=A0A397BC85_APHAT|nr:hypothetical protein DYB36_001818 [Aphanomyces astaci]RHY16351.1 hypothetical protein DYB25_000618 [Aphanomyces astaci]RHY42482.1 hypothetical protein DYB34_001909 [Aphanomyces astaci]RHY66832.1 hypothetical protein DYB38_001443 [Aphanomyces astaci]RHZ19100.1 hypothetical protein DYB26_001514 [Aphanomyces astaci]
MTEAKACEIEFPFSCGPMLLRTMLATQAAVRLWDMNEYADAVWIKPSGNVPNKCSDVDWNWFGTYSQRHPGNINSINATSSIITLSSKGALPPETVQTFTLAAFVALRVIEHLVDEFQNSRRHQNLHRGIFPLAACRHHLAQLWASTPVKDHHKLLHRDSVTCVQRVLSRRFVSDMHTASSVRVAVRHLLATLTENDIAVHDAAYVAENLFTPTLLSCGAAVDWVGRELGKALVQTSVVAAISVDVTIDTIQAAAISADDRQSGATGKKKK